MPIERPVDGQFALRPGFERFEQLIDALLPTLHEDVLQDATLLLGLYMNIRGYGSVKEESAEQVRLQVAQGLQTLTSIRSEAA